MTNKIQNILSISAILWDILVFNLAFKMTPGKEHKTPNIRKLNYLLPILLMQPNIAFLLLSALAKPLQAFTYLFQLFDPMLLYGMRFSQRGPAVRSAVACRAYCRRPSCLMQPPFCSPCFTCLMASGLPQTLVSKSGCVIYGLFLYLFCAFGEK